jgi:phosphoribosylamine--glycine ligase
MKNILIIGNGGREHVIAETFARSPQEVRLVAYGNTKNLGLDAYASRYEVGSFGELDRIVKLAQDENIDFAFLGPEAAIEAGVSDALIKSGIGCVSPTMNTGRIETSKLFTRNLFNHYKIPGNPVFKSFNSDFRMRDFISLNLGDDFVVKADGLKSGKGVFVKGDHFNTVEEGMEIAKKLIDLDGSVLIEEKFVGQEFSLMFFTDGKTLVPMPVVQDNKRAFEDDKGPNTGGMGSYSMADHLLPFINKSDVDYATLISKQVIEAIAKECKEYYKGVLYGSFIKTRTGIKVIEYNARFGDPEVLNVLPILKTDFVKICESIINATLHIVPVQFANFATVCKYIVPEGYPEKPVKDVEIEMEKISDDIRVYYAGMEKRDGKFFITGSRTLAMVGVDPKIKKAELLAEEGCWRVKGPVFYRPDIGKDYYLAEKVKMMEGIIS